MNTCKTCKFWGELSQYYPPTNHRLCLNPKLIYGSGLDGDDTLRDNADYDYGLSTGPNFGCIHHETKE